MPSMNPKALLFSLVRGPSTRRKIQDATSLCGRSHDGEPMSLSELACTTAVESQRAAEATAEETNATTETGAGTDAEIATVAAADAGDGYKKALSAHDMIHQCAEMKPSDRRKVHELKTARRGTAAGSHSDTSAARMQGCAGAMVLGSGDGGDEYEDGLHWPSLSPPAPPPQAPRSSKPFSVRLEDLLRGAKVRKQKAPKERVDFEFIPHIRAVVVLDESNFASGNMPAAAKTSALAKAATDDWEHIDSSSTASLSDEDTNRIESPRSYAQVAAAAPSKQ